MTKKDTAFHSQKAPEPVGRYPHARRVGDFLFLSGVGPRKLGSKEIPGVTLGRGCEIVGYDLEIQTLSVFENSHHFRGWRAVGPARGCTVYLTNMKSFSYHESALGGRIYPNPPYDD